MATVQQTITANANVATGTIEVYIEDVNRTDLIYNRTISISDQLNARVNTASFKIYDLDNSYVPAESDDVVIYDAYGNKVFGGIVTILEEQRIALNPSTSTEILAQSITCQDYTRLLQKKLIVETYQDMTCADIINEIIDKYYPNEGFTVTNVETGPTITQIAFNYKYGDQALDALAQAAGYQWHIDYEKDIHFFLSTSLTSQMTLTDSTTNWTNLIIKPDKSQIKNRVYVRGGIYYSDPYTQSIQADGVQEEFLLAYTPSETDFTVSISSTPRSVGIHNVDNADNFDFMLNRKEKNLKMGNTAWAQANTPLAADAVLICIYNYEIPVLIVQEDSASIAAMKALEGGDGIYEYIIVDKNITSIQAARDRAAAELRDYANTITRGGLTSYDSSVAYLKSGDIFTINSSRRGINADYLIQSVKIDQLTTTQFKYTLDFSGKLYEFVDLLMALFKRSQEIILGLDEVLDAFFGITDATTAINDGGINHQISATPFKWSNDAGTTVNKMRWSLFEWA